MVEENAYFVFGYDFFYNFNFFGVVVVHQIVCNNFLDVRLSEFGEVEVLVTGFVLPGASRAGKFGEI